MMFKKVFNKASEGKKQRCREGDMSIKSAYNSLTPKKAAKKKPDIVIDTTSGQIFDECEKNQNIGKTDNSQSKINIPDPAPMANEITMADVPDGSIWLVLNPMERLVQVVKKTPDKEKGEVLVKINSYSCKTVSRKDGLTIFEAHHIDGGTEQLTRKDDSGFDLEQKKAS